MGIKDNKPIAHKLIPRFASEWGTSAMTVSANRALLLARLPTDWLALASQLHGRSRQQRYSRLADWNYIKECSETLRATCEENNLPKVEKQRVSPNQSSRNPALIVFAFLDSDLWKRRLLFVAAVLRVRRGERRRRNHDRSRRSHQALGLHVRLFGCSLRFIALKSRALQRDQGATRVGYQRDRATRVHPAVRRVRSLSL